jgi:hypothetical protein
MAIKKFIDSTGLATLWEKIKALIPGIATSSKAGIVKSGGDITVAADGAVTVNNHLKLSGGTMTGNVKKKEGDYVSLVPSKAYSSYYLQFMKITYVGASLDVPIEIRLLGRGSHQYIIQVNNNSGSPNNVTFYTVGNAINDNGGIYYKYDSTARTLSLLFHHGGGGGWEDAAVTDVVVPNNHHDKFTFDYTISEVANTTGWTKASRTTFHYAISERAIEDGSGNTITSTYANKTELTDGSVTKVGTATLGSTTKPIYLSSGVPTTGTTYAGGTKVTLNGTNLSGSTATFYAPKTYGSSGHVLIAKGSGASPVFKNTIQIGSGATSKDFIKLYGPLSFFNILQVAAGETKEFDWSYASAVVYNGGTIKFSSSKTEAISRSVVPVWIEKGGKIKVDEWDYRSGTTFLFNQNTYTAIKSGTFFVNMFADPICYVLSSHEIFDKTLVISSLSDSRLTLVQSSGSSYYIIDLSSNNILYDGIVFDIPNNSYPSVTIGSIKMNNIPNCHVVRLYAKSGTITLSRLDTDYSFAVTPGGSSYHYINRNCYTEVMWYGNRWLTRQY